MKLRVIIADDQPVVRAGLSALLESSGGIEVIAEAASGPEAVAKARQLRPDVVCLDVRMPGGDGIAATREIAGPEVTDPIPVVVITTFDLDEYVFGALEAGACGVLLKDCDPAELLAGVHRAAAGEGLVAATLTRRVITEFARRANANPVLGEERELATELTPREVQCIRALCEGYTNAEIAAQLQVEVSTVKTHLSSAMNRTGARDRVQLVIWAFRSGLVS